MVAGNEPVTSPDQHKPTNMKAARIGAFVTAFALVAMALWGNHEGNVENIWLLGLAATLIGIVLADWLLRKNGLRS